jgi:hypothetical protein
MSCQIKQKVNKSESKLVKHVASNLGKPSFQDFNFNFLGQCLKSMTFVAKEHTVRFKNPFLFVGSSQ